MGTREEVVTSILRNYRLGYLCTKILYTNLGDVDTEPGLKNNLWGYSRSSYIQTVWKKMQTPRPFLLFLGWLPLRSVMMTQVAGITMAGYNMNGGQ